MYRDGVAIDEISGLIDQIDDSNYSTVDWLVTLVAFDRWLEAKQIEERPLETMVGYIHCCTMTSAETLDAPPLDRLLVRMLDEFGFDAAQETTATD